MYARLPRVIAHTRLIREQYGLSLNRVGQGELALEVLREVAPCRWCVTQWSADSRKKEEPDYWDYATLMELAVHADNRDEAEDFLGSALARNPVDWMKETTAKQLKLLAAAAKGRGQNVDWVQLLIRALDG